ncbi:MAG: DNA mismatch repair endonuclease MutL [Gemmatimonadetes bacterium]|nr:DNA mismatch repair endonuclease MutL [Gemmatimonadota bacterium]
MGRIAILADAVANQIAAGEVVERPASVVKELVENALDAGATSITIDLEAGGRTAIAVSDDGVGMDRDDAVLAIDRHATSKIRAASDLIGVPTYGFRGEALPAIASVARFELETALAGDYGTDATSIVVEGGRLKSVDVTSRQRGTTVKVQRLFFNTPARRKFLRKPAAETRAAVAAVSLLALTRLDVAFTVTSDGRVIAKAPRVSAFADRIQSLYGRELAEGLVAVDHHAGPVSVRGFIQRPADAKPTGRKAFLFVNGRPFRDHFLVRAAEAGYRATIHPGARPTLFLSLGVPGDAVDVNVHPAKLEVRFRDRRFVEQCVEEAVRHALGGIDAAAVVRPWFAASGRVAEGSPTPPPAFTDRPSDAAAPSLFEGRPGGDMDPDALFAHGDFLQVFNTYIVMQTPDGLAIVDQHSAHERVLFEQAMKHLTGEGAPSQRLLLPITVDLEPQELEAVSHSRELLNAIGFEAEEFGGRSLVIHAVPNPHPRFDARRCFEEVVADLARGRFGGWNNELERFAATYACRAAIKAGHVLEPRETRTLLNRLFACELPPHDVHGRPTIVQLPKEELERRFGRG